MKPQLFLFCAFVSLSSPLVAQERRAWDDAGDWRILVDPDLGDGCLMQKDYEDGIRVEFGFDPQRKGGFFAAMKQDWFEVVEPGSSGIVKFITNEAKFAGDVEMIEREGRFGGWAFFNNPNLVTEIAARRSLTVIGPRGRTFDLDLTGTSRAIQMLKKCQAAQ